MENVNEGQTQVYLNGMTTPQYGVNNMMPHLNEPTTQLMSLVVEFFKSGKSPAQVIAILVGMGVAQQLAQSAVHVYCIQNPTVIMSKSGIKNTNPHGYPSPNGNIKNINALTSITHLNNPITEKNKTIMQFTLNNLYNKVQEAISAIEKMDSDESKISYSVKNVKNLLETTVNKFPNLTLSQDILNSLSESEITAIKEGKMSTLDVIDFKINPNIKFGIANILFRESAQFDWLNPIDDLRNYIKESHSYNKWSFRLSEAFNSISSRNNQLDQRLSKDVMLMLNESADVIEDSIIKASKSNPWSKELLQISNEINESRKGAKQGKVSVNRTYSPILIEGNSYIFNLNGKNYRMSANTLRECGVSDSRYLRVIEAISLFSKNDELLTISGKSSKLMEINLSDSTIKIGDSDFTNSNANTIKEALMSLNFFSHRDLWKIDKICSLVENLDMIVELDNFLTLSSDQYRDVFLNMISVDEGVWINKVNGSMRLNELKFVNTATEALNEAKSFINYDASAYLSEKLIKEGNELAKITEKRNILNKELTFLGDKKNEIENSIKRMGNVTELDEALSLINLEISKKEKELQSTYIVEKKTKDQYLNDGYVEATLKKSVKSLKAGQSILINAEEFSSLGANDLIDVIDVDTSKSHLIPKKDISISFD